MRILVVEDNESHRKLTKLMLDRLGYQSDAVSDGYQAIQAVKHNQYGLVLMDIVMPGIDGLQAAREIRKLGKRGMKIISITAYVYSGFRDMCLEAGMDDCITKPVCIRDLENALKRIDRL